MTEQYVQVIRPILDTFDKIKEEIKDLNEEIEIPEIVVVGIQSPGKSSVLESIADIELPKGDNTVTRCPIILQLRNTNDKEYAQIHMEEIHHKQEENISIDEKYQKEDS